jgi:DNA-binding NtrC family response regulator
MSQHNVLLGESEPIRTLRSEIEHAARTEAKVLLLGETGAGKEVAARLIHEKGERHCRPFVAVNCSGIAETLLESELFGHVRGSFTDAYRDKPGLVQAAEGGTLFLDELGEMSLRMQAVLLRFAETGEIQRVGSDRAEACAHVRLIAATNRDLRTQIANGLFREDLYYRLNVVEIVIPPLRERVADIPLLLHHFLRLASELYRLPCPRISSAAQRVLDRYSWPGNVRELKNLAERLVVKVLTGPVIPDALPAEMLAMMPACEARKVADAEASSLSAANAADDLWRRVTAGDSFWTIADMYRAREVTRTDLRALVHRGLEETQGNYRRLLALFHLPEDDYKRFHSFLRQHQCKLPFLPYRVAKRPVVYNDARAISADRTRIARSHAKHA